MNKLLVMAVEIVLVAVLSGNASAQPEATGYTLSDIYYYLTEGVESGEGAHSLEPPEGSVPGDSSSQTVDQIYEDIKALYEQCNVTPGQVMEAVTYFSADTDNWGPRVGTILVKDSFSGADGDKVIDIPDGYYATKTVTAQDSDLVSGNIRSGVNIFGVSGNSSVIDTGAGDASASDILQGKKAYVSGSEVTGNISSKGAQTYTPGTSNQSIDAGQYLSGIQKISGSANLVAGNIKEGVDIFAVTGSLMPPAGTATSNDVLAGKTFNTGQWTSTTGTMAYLTYDMPTLPHTTAQCIDAGGSVFDAGGGLTACYLLQSACPAGWVQAGNWQQYSIAEWGGDHCGRHYSTAPTSFSNVPATDLSKSSSWVGGSRDKWNCEQYVEYWHVADYNSVYQIIVVNNPTTDRLAIGCR